MGKKMESIEDAVAEMRRLKSKLPPRPSLEDLNYATLTIGKVDSDLFARLDELSKQTRPPGVPYHVFRAYLEMREDLIRHRALEEKRMAVGFKELEDRHLRFDNCIQIAQKAASHPLGNTAVHDGSAYDYKQPGVTTPDGSKHKGLPPLSEDTSYSAPIARTSSFGHLGALPFKESASALKSDSAANSSSPTPLTQEAPTPDSQPYHGGNAGRSYPPQLLQVLERAHVERLKELNLNKTELEYVPEYIGNLTALMSLNLSANSLKALPESICELINLTALNINNNQLKDLPEAIGCLTNLKFLDMEHNKIEELPITIGLCTQLVELNAGFNELKVLPEATGKLVLLQKLNIHLNHVQHLPTTLHNLKELVVLKISFNEIGRIPDSVCRLPKLTILDVSSNFADLRELPAEIGLMQSLRELYLSTNQISQLPRSFARLTGLQKLDMEANPWQIPPMDVVRKGKEAVLKFMIETDAREEHDEQENMRRSGFGGRMASIFKKKRSSSSPYKVKSVNPLNIRA